MGHKDDWGKRVKHLAPRDKTSSTNFQSRKDALCLECANTDHLLRNRPHTWDNEKEMIFYNFKNSLHKKYARNVGIKDLKNPTFPIKLHKIVLKQCLLDSGAPSTIISK